MRREPERLEEHSAHNARASAECRRDQEKAEWGWPGPTHSGKEL